MPAPLKSLKGHEDIGGQELEIRPQNEENEKKEEKTVMASPWSGPGNQAD